MRAKNVAKEISQECPIKEGIPIGICVAAAKIRAKKAKTVNMHDAALWQGINRGLGLAAAGKKEQECYLCKYSLRHSLYETGVHDGFRAAAGVVK